MVLMRIDLGRHRTVSRLDAETVALLGNDYAELPKLLGHRGNAIRLFDAQVSYVGDLDWRGEKGRDRRQRRYNVGHGVAVKASAAQRARSPEMQLAFAPLGRASG